VGVRNQAAVESLAFMTRQNVAIAYASPSKRSEIKSGDFSFGGEASRSPSSPSARSDLLGLDQRGCQDLTLKLVMPNQAPDIIDGIHVSAAADTRVDPNAHRASGRDTLSMAIAGASSDQYGKFCHKFPRSDDAC
jgi:hypothetical protein